MELVQSGYRSPGVIYCLENIKYWLQYKLPQYFIRRNSIFSPPTLDKDRARGETQRKGNISFIDTKYLFLLCLMLNCLWEEVKICCKFLLSPPSLSNCLASSRSLFPLGRITRHGLQQVQSHLISVHGRTVSSLGNGMREFEKFFWIRWWVAWPVLLDRKQKRTKCDKLFLFQLPV